MHVRFRIRHKDPGHVHFAVFVGNEADQTHAKAGDLVLTPEEFDRFTDNRFGREIVDETEAFKDMPEPRSPYVVRFWIEDQMSDYDARLTSAEAETLREELTKHDDVYDVQVFQWGGEPIVGLPAMLKEVDSLFDKEDEDVPD